ncbi:MAG TPA: PCRF domain-containing protein, partial [Gelria sp.]|nr:PCRF domain-containing protein [Gelria sp.]
MDGQKQRVEQLHKKTLDENFWNERQEAQQILKNISDIQDNIDKYYALWDKINYLKELLDMAQEDGIIPEFLL